MTKKQANQNQKRLVVSIQFVAVPDADERRRRAIDILLQAAARDTSQSKESQNTKKPRKNRQQKEPMT